MQVNFHFERLKEARLEKRLTQEELAERCDTSCRYIRDLEKGRKAHPSTKMLFLLASGLDIPVEELVDVRQDFDE